MLRRGLGGTCLVIGLALAIVIASVMPARAGAPTERVREFFASANRILVDPVYDLRLDERLTALRRLVTEMVDFRNAAAVALGPEWSARSMSERDEFVRLFTDLLETSVFASVGARARIDHGIIVTYTDEVEDGDATTVMTTVLTRSGREMSVGYRMALRQDRWVVQDLVVDGVSLVDNYRAQFLKFMQRSSYAGLVSEMRGRIADLGRSTAAASLAGAPAPITSATPVIAAVQATPTLAAPVIVRDVREDVAPFATPPAIAMTGAQPLVVAAVTPREARPVEVRVPDVRVLERPVARGERYWVQVGAFRNPEKAMQAATALRDETVSLFTAPDNPLLRVVVGPFPNRDAATSKLREIRARGYDAFIAEATN